MPGKPLFKSAPPRIHPIRIFVFLGMVIALVTLSYARNSLWQNNLSLLEDTANKSFLKARVHYNLGCEYGSAGLPGKAIVQYQTELELNPAHAEAHFNLGVVYVEVGETGEARKEFETALALNHNDLKARKFLDYISRNP